MQKYQDVSFMRDGSTDYVRLVLSATITVRLNSSQAIATIYSDNGSTVKDNPFTSSAIDGAYNFYAADNLYDVTISKTGYETESKTAIQLAGVVGGLSGALNVIGANMSIYTAPDTNTFDWRTAAGLARWRWYTSGSETGSNAGSDLLLEAFNDAGTTIGTFLVFDRSSLAAIYYGSIISPAATTSISSMRLPHGTAPTSPTNGDMWTTTAGLYVRINGSTVGPLS